MEEQLTLEEILREGMIGSPAKELHSDDLQRAAERGDTEGEILTCLFVWYFCFGSLFIFFDKFMF